MATRTGSADNDTLTGTEARDEMFGRAGDDTLFGLDGADLLDGEDGDDILYGGAGDDLILASLGNDSYFGGEGTDTVSFRGADRFVSVNILTDNSAFASLTDGKTYDSIEVVEGTVFDDVMTSYGEVRRVNGGQGNDRLEAWVNGLDLPDRFHGGAQDDILLGRGGNDRLFGGFGNDTVDGGAGRDIVIGGRGADSLTGGDGEDLLKGGARSDTLDGGADDDVLRGGKGRDTLDGGQGNDFLSGGRGRDTFVIDVTGGRDVVRDFDARGDERLLLSQVQFSGAPVAEVFAALVADARDTDAGLVLDLGPGGQMVLRGLSRAEMSEDWFTYF